MHAGEAMLRQRHIRVIQSRAWHGLHDYETHRVPLGALILDAKYCELCGYNFLRRLRSRDRYCSKCLRMILSLNPQQGGKLGSSNLIH